jgi:hypothetical protein
MSSSPRSPAEHYREAERLLRAAKSSVEQAMQTTAALAAIGHAVLANVSRRRAPRRSTPPAGPASTRFPRAEGDAS